MAIVNSRVKKYTLFTAATTIIICTTIKAIELHGQKSGKIVKSTPAGRTNRERVRQRRHIWKKVQDNIIDKDIRQATKCEREIKVDARGGKDNNRGSPTGSLLQNLYIIKQREREEYNAE